MLGTDSNTETFLAVRGPLLSIAPKIVGGAADAEDVVQDAWLHWNRIDRDIVRDATAYLCQITVRSALTTLRSAHVRNRSPLELPMDQPDVDADPALAVESMERLREATHLMVRRLTPCGQVAYVLRDAFLEAARSGDVPAARDGRSDMITFVDAVVATGIEAAWHSELGE